MMLYYNAIMNQEEEVKRENYGKMQQYPEVSDFFCPTCGRHFSNYQHCHRHAEVRNHNKSFVFCNYSFKGLPRCHRSSTKLKEDHLFGSCCFAGRKRRMEDIHWVSPYDIDTDDSSNLPVLYGLCDGHRGTNAAAFLATQIEQVAAFGFSHLVSVDASS